MPHRSHSSGPDQYNPQTNRCYVELASRTSDETDPNLQESDDLYDGQTGEQLASVISQGKNCPNDPCKTTGVVYDVQHKSIAGSTYAQDAKEYIDDLMDDDRKR